MKTMKAGFGLYAYAVVGDRQPRRPVRQRLRLQAMPGGPSSGTSGQVNYKDLTLIGKVVKIADFQTQLKQAVKNPKTMETVLTEHQGFLDRLMTKTTVVPFQFGTILKDKQAAAAHLKSGYVKYQKLLTKFKNRQEWGVRVFADLQKLKSGLGQSSPRSSQKLGSGTAYLLRKKQAEAAETAAQEKLAVFSAEILNQLKKFAVEYKPTKSAQRFSDTSEPLISVFAFLVDKSKVRKFSQKLKNQQKKYQKFGLSLTSSGPWPAYNFVN